MAINWKYRILNGWNFMRVLRVGLAIFVIVESFIGADVFLGLLGGIVLLQGLLNVGCCGISGCDTLTTYKEARSTRSSIEDVTYKEIK